MCDFHIEQTFFFGFCFTKGCVLVRIFLCCLLTTFCVSVEDGVEDISQLLCKLHIHVAFNAFMVPPTQQHTATVFLNMQIFSHSIPSTLLYVNNQAFNVDAGLIEDVNTGPS